MATGKTKQNTRVRVVATRNLDLMNVTDPPTELERTDQVEGLLASHDLVEVDEAGEPVDADISLGTRPAAPATPAAPPAAPAEATPTAEEPAKA